MSDASQVKLSFRDEDVWGETPASVSPQRAGREFRFTSESLNFNHDTETSNEIRDDRNISDIIRVAQESSGDVNIEQSFGSHDPLIEGAFFDNWSTAVDLNEPASQTSPFDNVTVTVTANVSSPDAESTGTIAAASGTPFANLNPGDWFRLTETGSPNVDGYYLITEKASGNSVTVQPSPAVSTSGAFRIRASAISNGTTFKSFLLEKEFRDIGQFLAFTGMRVGSWSQSISPGSILTGAFSFQGEDVLSAQTTQFTTSPQVEAVDATQVLNSVDNISNILIDGAAPDNVFFTEISFNMDNQLRPQPAISFLANIGIGAGQVQIEGTLNSYFQNLNLYNKFKNFNNVRLSFVATDEAGNSTLYFFPSFRITSGEVVAGGNNQDVFANFGFTAKRDSTFGFAIGLNRFAADNATLLPGTADQA